MAQFTRQGIAKYVNEKTGLDVNAVSILIVMTSGVREYLRSQLLVVLTKLRNEKRKVLFDSVRGDTSAVRIRALMAPIDTAIDSIDRIYSISPTGNKFSNRVPWSELADESESFARLLDIIKKFTNKIPPTTIGNVSLPGLKGINSLDDLKRRKDELSFQLQQMLNVKSYAQRANARLDASLKEVEKWINSIDIIDGFNNQAYRFSGNIYSGGTPYSIYWEAGTLYSNDNEYEIEEGSITDLPKGISYMYFDSAGNTKQFTHTTGQNEAKSGDNILILRATVDGIGSPVMLIYGTVDYS